ncbi:hypothetical protein HanHA300_Chr16g0634211 [Helianthus annuus]|nr:hypothetical protein HanHA300_Chr16g0634211 [Helianthus annuus]
MVKVKDWLARIVYVHMHDLCQHSRARCRHEHASPFVRFLGYLWRLWACKHPSRSCLAVFGYFLLISSLHRDMVFLPNTTINSQKGVTKY